MIRQHQVAVAAVGPWFVSTTHSIPSAVYSGEAPQPYGVRHARRPGDGQTACGRTALEWKLFWEVPFDPDASDVCVQCASWVTGRQPSL